MNAKKRKRGDEAKKGVSTIETFVKPECPSTTARHKKTKGLKRLNDLES